MATFTTGHNEVMDTVVSGTDTQGGQFEWNLGCYFFTEEEASQSQFMNELFSTKIK